QHTANMNRITLNTMFQGMWTVLLYLLSGQRDVLFGSTSSGRSLSIQDVEQIVGLFINTIPVRVLVDDQMKFSTLLATIQSDQAEARYYDYTPLSRIQSWSDVPRPL